MIRCAYCGDDADDRPVKIEAVCWPCWGKMYGDNTEANRQAWALWKEKNEEAN